MTEQARIGVVIPPSAVDRLFRDEAREAMERLGQVVWSTHEGRLGPDEAATMLANCTVGVGSWGTVVPDARMLATCPGLKLWVHAAGSVRGIVQSLPAESGLTVASCAPAIAANVAEFTLGLLITGLKRAYDSHADSRRPAGEPQPDRAWVGPRRNLDESVVGVVAASQVGRRVIDLIRPMGAKVLVFDPFLSDQNARDLGVERVEDLPDLCRRCHALTVHAPGLPETRGLVGAQALRALPDDAILINTSRGSCIDESALIAELRKGRLFALLDVSDPEPAAPDSPLRTLPNVRLSSHIAGGPSPKIGDQAVADIAAFLEGRRPTMAVTAEMLDRVA